MPLTKNTQTKATIASLDDIMAFLLTNQQPVKQMTIEGHYLIFPSNLTTPAAMAAGLYNSQLFLYIPEPTRRSGWMSITSKHKQFVKNNTNYQMISISAIIAKQLANLLPELPNVAYYRKPVVPAEIDYYQNAMAQLTLNTLNELAFADDEFDPQSAPLISQFIDSHRKVNFKTLFQFIKACQPLFERT